MVKKFLYTTHRILGTLLSILFLVWFLSGFVMIYHTFPKVQQQDKYRAMPLLGKEILSLDSLTPVISESETIQQIQLQKQENRDVYKIKTDKQTHHLSATNPDEQVQPISFKTIQSYASRWVNAEIEKVDTLYKLEQWIPFSRYRDDMPIYKFYFADNLRHQLYISSITGEALQFTNKDNRFWSWLGAIPHWIYFTGLRQDARLWSGVIIWLSGIGCIMCLAGIILGFRSYYVILKKRRRWKSPYHKPAYKWHHILGFFFGIFVFTFAFSGMMSLATVPQWIAKVHDPSIQKKLLQKGQTLPEAYYQTGLQELFQKYQSELKSIEWTSFGNNPIYKVIVGDTLIYLDASGEKIQPLSLNEDDISTYLSLIHTETIQVTRMDTYDNYYITRKDPLPLPVYKTSIDDLDKSVYYVNPQTGDIRYFNTNSRIRRWTYQALHSYSIKVFVERPILWNIIMWLTMIGGTIVSFTGVLLGIKYIKRILKRKRQKKSTYDPDHNSNTIK